MNQEQLQAIQERVNKATPGPWMCSFWEGTDEVESIGRATTEEWHESVMVHVEGLNKNNGTFIAHAREDVPALFDEVERLRGVVRAIRAEAMAAYESEDENIRVAGGALLFQLQQRQVWIKRGRANDDVIFEDEMAGEST